MLELNILEAVTERDIDLLILEEAIKAYRFAAEAHNGQFVHIQNRVV